ncbi:hypothetical protein C6P40_002066 [Pichia californica]|uniref:Uncharacterized protein n=1 Tax=Pichia californica TaxID=460514 RepID=A0A9P6WIM0_9ASCO|nr:hypothetical protein C6P40_002066 [[Candida] californica]
MKKNRSFNSPLSRIEQEVSNQKKSNKIKSNKRVSVISTISTDSVSTTGRLLDKLKLADNEWDDSDKSVISIPMNDPDTSIGSLNTLNSENSIKINSSSHSDINENSNVNVLPLSKFKYLKSILNDTKRKNSQKSAVNKALEMGKKINTVEQNISHVVNRSSVKSIHLDTLFRDADSSISSFDSHSELESESNDNDDDDDDDDYYDNGEQNIIDNYADPITINQTPEESEFSFIPNTPTKNGLNSTPLNSPGETIIATPGYSINTTPKMYMRSHHNHTHSTLSNTSFKADSINESFLGKNKNDDEIPKFHNHTRNYSGNNINKTPIAHLLDNSKSFHQHTHSMANAIGSNSSVDSEMAKNINETLMRSASVPIKRNPSIKRTPVPKSPLPFTPATMEKSSTFEESNLPNFPKNITNHSPYNSNQFEHIRNYQNYPPPPQQQQQDYNQQQQNISHMPQQHVAPQIYQQQQQQKQPLQHQLHYHNEVNTTRGMTSPSSNQFHFVQSPQSYQHRNFNPSFNGNLVPHSRMNNQHKVMQQTQQLLYPQQQQPQQQQYPNGNIQLSKNVNHNGNSSYINSQRYGNFSPQASPKIGHFAQGSYNMNNYYSEYYDGYNTPSTPPSHSKKNNKFQNVDLSKIMPR